MIKKSILLLSAAACLGGNAIAQKCATDEVNREMLKQHPEIAIYQEQLNAQFREAMRNKHSLPSGMGSTAKIVSPYNPTKDSTYPTVWVPIVVHIVHDYGNENISDQQIYDWVNQLNIVYKKANPDTSAVITEFKPYIGNARIQFNLATKDPFGQPTTGITRRQSYLSRGGDEQAKFDLWAPERYLNIWLVTKIGRGTANGVVAAYSTFPASAAANPYSDGIIGGAAFITSNKTYQHEIGHYFNLQHPWNSSNKGAGAECGDDEVDDTPPTRGHFGSGFAGFPNGKGDCNLPYVLYDYDTMCIGYKGTTIRDPNFNELSTASVNFPLLGQNYNLATSPYWDNLNSVAAAGDDTLGNFRAIGGYIAMNKNTAIRLITDSLSAGVYVPGRTVNGTIDKTTYLPVSGFPYKSRPASLIGYWRYAPQGSDQGYINVTLTKWDSITQTRATISNTTHNLVGTQANWSRFKIDLTYGTNGNNPDTAIITLSASSANSANWAAGSYLDIDELSLQNGNNGYYKTFTYFDGATKTDTADYPDVANVQNIMDYAECPIMFTHQQVDRMRNALKSTIGGRNNLITKENQIVTGIMDTATNTPLPRPVIKPVADFYVEKSSGALERSYFLCADPSKQFSFKNQSWRGGATNPTVNWKVSNDAAAGTGGAATINTSVAKYGWVDVELTASSAGGDSVLNKQKLVYAADPTYVKDPMNGYYQEFNADGDRDRWPLFNYYNNDFKWEVVDNNGYYDKSCLVYRGYDTRTGTATLTGAPAVHDPANGALLSKDYDDFYTTAFDLSKMTPECTMNWMYSGACRTQDISIMVDTLEVAYSVNCGTQFTTFAYLTKDQIFNKGIYGNHYAPLWMGDWALQSITVPTAARKESVYFRFRYKPNSDASKGEIGISNDFYIDRINISPYATGINTLLNNDRRVVVMPNPTNGNAYVGIKGAQNTEANVIVTDITGKVVFRTAQVLHDEVSRIEIPANAIGVKGVYMVQVIAGNQNYTDKLVSY